jgi:AbiV family abortive infection protein
MLKLTQTIQACVKNGDRLSEDAEYLFDFEKYVSAYALARLAQEEFSKCFILKLVQSGALKWTKEVRRSLNHHVSKQLMTLILEYINPDTDDFLRMIKNGTLLKRPRKVSDAINIYIHEVLRRWESANWYWAEEPEYDKVAKSILDGKADKIKQDAFYVKISKDGRAVKPSTQFGRKLAKEEYGQFVRGKTDDSKYIEIVEIIKMLNK